MFFAANGARFGFRATVPSNIGYHITTLAATIAIGLGLEWISHEALWLLRSIRYSGAAYMLHLAWRLARAGRLADVAEAKPTGFADGAILLLLNPEANLIIALMFTQFAGVLVMDRTAFVLWVGAVFMLMLNNMIAVSLYAALGDGMTARWRSPETARFLDLIFAAILVAVAGWMLFV